jgi:C4-dicarboxylate-specific signal transduction histidine kinase
MEQLAHERSQQLIHAERMATLGLLSAGIAHEIRNPLTFISVSAQNLSRGWPIMQKAIDPARVPDEQRKKIEALIPEMPGIADSILQGVRRISAIVDDLKNFSGRKSVDRESCDVNDCITAALRLSHNALKYHVRVSKMLDPDLPPVRANRQQLEQVFVNLFVNAADATEAMKTAELTIETKTANHAVAISVVDNGPGIQKKNLEKLFRPFFTTKSSEKSTGLGLFICRGIIESFDGKITVTNGNSGGAEFTIALPACAR